MIELIAGVKGSGKTYYAKNQLKKFNNIVCVDVNHEYVGTEFDNYTDVLKAITKNDFPIRYFPADENEDELFLSLRYYKNLTILIDEAHLFISAYDKKTPLFSLLRFVRHLNLDVIMITQRFSDYPKQLISQATQLTTFRQWLPDDQKVLISWGFDAEKLKNLNDREFLTLQK